MANIKTHLSEGSVIERKITTVNYDVTHPTFNTNLSRTAIYSVAITGPIHKDTFTLTRDGSGKEIISDELNVSFVESTFMERFKIALAVLFPSFAEKYGAVITKYGLRDEEIQSLQPEVDNYNLQCGVGIQHEYMHSTEKETREISTGECLVDKL